MEWYFWDRIADPLPRFNFSLPFIRSYGVIHLIHSDPILILYQYYFPTIHKYHDYGECKLKIAKNTGNTVTITCWILASTALSILYMFWIFMVGMLNFILQLKNYILYNLRKHFYSKVTGQLQEPMNFDKWLRNAFKKIQNINYYRKWQCLMFMELKWNGGLFNSIHSELD